MARQNHTERCCARARSSVLAAPVSYVVA
jgi:hypothetical protein